MILMMYSNAPPSCAHVARLELIAQQPVCVAQTVDEASRWSEQCAIWLGHRFLHQTWVRRKHLQWLQITSAGATPLRGLNAPWPEYVTRCTVHSDAIAHHALALAWRQLRHLDETPPMRYGARDAGTGFWLPVPRKAMVLGQGAIGKRLSAMLIGLGLEVWGVSRSNPDELATAARLHWLGPQEWRGALGQMDLLFVCLPSQEGGLPMIGVAELSALPSTAVLVSISRSDVIDHEALMQTLRAGRLGGAALDMIVPADEMKLWQAPRLFLTSKTAAMHADFQPRLESFVEMQLSRWCNGETLLDIIQ